MLGEVPEVVKTGLWVGDCFIYTSSVNRLNYYVGGEIITIAHMDRCDAFVDVEMCTNKHRRGLFMTYGGSAVHF